MKHFRIIFAVLILALVLSACGSTSREPYTYTFSRDSVVKTITVNPEVGTILDGTDVYNYVMEKSGSRTGYVITYPNGATYHWTESGNGGAGGWSETYDESRYIPGSILVWAIEENQPREKVGSVGIGLLLMALGAWHILSPESVFYLSRGWMFRDAEPSDFYLTLARVSGGVFAILGLAACFI